MKSKMKNVNGVVYMLVTADKFEFPIFIMNSLKEIADFLNMKYESIRSAWHRDAVLEDCYKIRRVDTREPKDKFNLFEYKEFCEKKGCPLDSFSSVKQFANQCYGASADLCV
jgi:hypothetical protein